MTVNHLVTGSNPVSGATQFNTPRTPTNTIQTRYLASEYSNYDTINKKCDTKPLRLYKVDKTFYYRRRIKQKLFRISLKTKNIKVALKRRKILDLIDGEEMFQIDTGDFKLMFEYETEEELLIALESVKKMQIQAQLSRYREVKEHIRRADSTTTKAISFEMLRDTFIAKKKASERVSADSIGAYITTFKLLISFFKDREISTISVEDFENFQQFLKNGKRSNKTVNKHIKYLRNFITFAVHRNLLDSDNTKAIILLDELKDEQLRKLKVENYSDEEVNSILSYKYDNEIYNKILAIAVYTGMRISEIHNIDNADIKEADGVYYIDITKSKTLAGIRKVPIHREILQIVQGTTFPLIPISKNAFQKKVRDRLYKVINKGEGKNVHTLRGTFMAKAIHTNLKEHENIVPIVQDIVGHTKNSKEALTGGTYAKGIAPLVVQKEIINSIIF